MSMSMILQKCKIGRVQWKMENKLTIFFSEVLPLHSWHLFKNLKTLLSVVSKPRCWFLTICFTREMCCICEWSHWWIAECHIAAILKALDTIGICSKKNKRTNLIGNEHWRVLDSITYCEKRLLWSNVVFEKEVFLNQNYLNLFWPVALFRHLKAHNNIVQYRCFCFHYSPATLMTNWV